MANKPPPLGRTQWAYAREGMADRADADAAFEPAWNSCCDATSCSEAVRQQGWQTLQELQRQKDIFTDGQVWLVWHSRPRGYKCGPAFTACVHPLSPRSLGRVSSKKLCPSLAQRAEDFVNGQVCAVLYLTGLETGSLISVSQVVHHMKLNMKVSLAPSK